MPRAQLGVLRGEGAELVLDLAELGAENLDLTGRGGGGGELLLQV